MRQAGEVNFADAHNTRRNEGCVEFASKEDLENALRELDGTEFYGKRIKLTDLSIQKSSSGESSSKHQAKSKSPRSLRNRSKSPKSSRNKSRGWCIIFSSGSLAFNRKSKFLLFYEMLWIWLANGQVST